MATKGEYVKLSHEFAGIGGDASFYKVQSETVISRRIASNAVCNLFHFSFVGRSHLRYGSVCLYQPGPESCGVCSAPPTSPIGSSLEDLRTCGCSEIIVWDLGTGVRLVLHFHRLISGLTYLYSGFPGWGTVLGCWSELDLRFPKEAGLASKDPFIPQCWAARQYRQR